jgi:hypothetical protein
MSKMKLALNVVQDLRNLADSIEALANAADSGEVPAADQPVATPEAPALQQKQSETPKPTLVELRAFVAEKSTPENRTRIKAILEKFDVKKLTELAEDQYPALMREVEAL